jgi:uncharacterized protein involved in copper resistance
MHPRSSLAFRTALATGLVLAAIAAPAQAQQSLASRTPPVDVASFSRTVDSTGQAVTQAPATDSASTNAVSTQMGPTMDAASVAVRQPVTKDARSPNAAPVRAGYGQPVALMVVGGAALLAGLIISGGAGTAIAVGGAVVGLYGLYEFLQ